MPMIEAKVTVKLNEEKRNSLKDEFARAISVMNKPADYLMINLADCQDLYFGGRKLEKGAYIEVKVLGKTDRTATEKMTGEICKILKSQLDIPFDSVYVSYFGTDCWGWNGKNF